MARVPRAQNAVALQPISGEKFQAFDRGAGYAGRGLQALAGGFQDVAQEAQRQQDIFDDAAAKELDNSFTAAAREMLHTGEGAYFTLKGKDAALARNQTEAALRKLAEDHLGRVTTKQQKRMLQDVLARRVNSGLADVAQHGIAQEEVWHDQQSIVRVQEATQDAVLYRNDPVKFDGALKVIESEILGSAERKGWDSEYTQAQLAKARGGIHANIVKQMSIDDPVAAQTYLREHEAEIGDPDVIFGLENMLDGPALEQWADEEADTFRGLVTPSEAPDAPAETATSARTNETVARPIAGAVSSTYGWRKDPITGERKFHKGRDIPAPMGSPVGASLSGKVEFAGDRNDGYGNQIIVDHGNGRKTRYAHLSAISVKQGATVQRGGIIGKVGSTGRSTGPHLHWEMIVDGRAVDPEKGGQVAVSVAAGGGASRSNSAENDSTDLQAQIAAVEGSDHYTYRQKQALIAALTKKDGRDRVFKARREEEAYDNVTRTMLALGDGFTNVTQLGASYFQLSPQQQVTVTNVAKANAAPKPVETDMATFWALKQMQAVNPGAFARLDPFSYAGKLAPGDLRQLITDQAQVFSAEGKLTPQAVDRSRLFSVAKDALEAAGIDTSDSKDGRKFAAQRVRFLDQMQQFATIWAKENPGKSPDDATIRRWAGTWLHREEGQPMLFQMQLSQIEKTIKPQERALLEQSLRRNGIPVTPENLARVYLRSIRDRGY